MESQLNKHELLDLGFTDTQIWQITVKLDPLLSMTREFNFEEICRNDLKMALVIQSWPNDNTPEILRLVEMDHDHAVFEIQADSEIPKKLLLGLRKSETYFKITKVKKVDYEIL